MILNDLFISIHIMEEKTPADVCLHMYDVCKVYAKYNSFYGNHFHISEYGESPDEELQFT